MIPNGLEAWISRNSVTQDIEQDSKQGKWPGWSKRRVNSIQEQRKKKQIQRNNLLYLWDITNISAHVLLCFSMGLRISKGSMSLNLEHPSHLSPHSTPLTSYWGLVWVPWVIQLMSIGYLFYILWHMLTYCSLNTSHPLLSLLAISISQFSMSVSWLSSVQSLSRVWVFATPWITACQASLSITNSWSLLKLMSIELVMPSSHLIFCRPLLLLPPIPPSIRVFSNETILCIRWPKYWSFGFSISPSNEHPGLISSRMNQLDLLAVQGTLKSLLQHHSSKASVFRC